MAAPNLDDYVEVADRIIAFHAKYPEGTLQSSYEYFTDDSGRPFMVVVSANAYRKPDDPRPATGLAAELIPGKTPYTRDSELQNAETAAWGRAIIAVGASASKKVASREEVRNRATEADNLAGLKALGDYCAERGWTTDAAKRTVAEVFSERFKVPASRASNDDLLAFIALVKEDTIVITFTADYEQPGG